MDDLRAAAWQRTIHWLDGLAAGPYGTDDVARWLARSRYGGWLWPRTSFTTLCLSPHEEHARALTEPFVTVDYVASERALRVRYYRQIGQLEKEQAWPAANCVTAMERAVGWLRGPEPTQPQKRRRR